MRPANPALRRRLKQPDSKSLAARTPDVGLVLMDMSLRPIAIDRGASAILNGKASWNVNPRMIQGMLPKELADAIGNHRAEDLPGMKLTFRIGTSDYRCRAYVLEAHNALPSMVALHIEKISATDAISAVVAKFNLTEREHETLRGISMGLSSKELASRMNISPNTVKVFLRLIMIKMGVSSRGAIISQILQHQSALGYEEEEQQKQAFTAGA